MQGIATIKPKIVVTIACETPAASTTGLALAMSLAKAHGAEGVRANVAALGLLDAGLSAGLDERARRDYLTFSAYRRLGTPAEVAPAIVWLALDAKAMNGKVLAVNGGV